MGGFLRKLIKRPDVAKALQQKAVKEAPAGPTVAELEQDEADRLLRIKRKGRRATKLSSTDDELTLSKKTLLG